MHIMILMRDQTTLHLLITASFIAGILIIYWLRTLDIHEKEPFHKLFLVTLLGGIASIIISLFIYNNFNFLGVTNIQTILGALLIIGPVEEGAKLVTFFLLLPLIRNELNEPTDGPIYMACIGLGFSLIENILYALNSDMPWTILSLRLITATPMHIGFSIFMGIAIYYHLFKQSNMKAIIVSYLFASIAHGLYDVAVFSGIGLMFIFVFAWIARHWILTILGYSASTSPFRLSLKEFINAHHTDSHSSPECTFCGNAEAKPTHKFEKIEIHHCTSCKHYMASKSSFYYLFRHFGSKFKRISSSEINDYLQDSTLYQSGNKSQTLNNKFIHFNIDTLDPFLERLARESEQALPRFLIKLLN